MSSISKRNTTGGKGAYQFSRSGPCLNTAFFACVQDVKRQKGMGGSSDLSQKQYLMQCCQTSELSAHENLLPQLAMTDLKIDEVKRN